MSLNLLNSYGSDSEEEKEEDDFGEPIKEAEEEEAGPSSEDKAPEISDKTLAESEVKSSFFSEEFGSSSDDDSDPYEEEEDAESGEKAAPRLPSARSVLSGTAGLESSLFISEAEKERDANNALLSQHVPVSEQEKKNKGFRGKRKAQPCRAFLRGSCSRGARCRFSHVIPDVKTSDAPPSVIESKAKFYNDPNEIFNKNAKLPNEIFSKKAKLK